MCGIHSSGVSESCYVLEVLLTVLLLLDVPLVFVVEVEVPLVELVDVELVPWSFFVFF